MCGHSLPAIAFSDAVITRRRRAGTVQLPDLQKQGAQARAHLLRTPLLVTLRSLSWSCYFRAAQEVCPLCGGISEKTDIYPLFIEQELSEPDDSSLPPRPLPVNRPKIPNADIISNRSVYDKSNVAMGRQFAGTVLLTPLAMAAYVTQV